MDRLLQYALAGLSAGSLYGLVALGVVLIYGATRTLNFAHGEVASFGTFVAFALLSSGCSFAVALPAAILAGAAVALVFYALVLVPAQRRGVTPISQVTLTLGLGLVLQGILLGFFGAEPDRLPFPLSDTASWKIGPLYVSQLSAGTLAGGLAVAAGLRQLVLGTRLGLAMRACSENLTAAQTLGIPTRAVVAFSWALAASLGVVSGLFLAPALLLDPFFMTEPFLKGLAAAVLGGLTSLPGAVAGGLILGVSESLAGAYVAVEFKNTLAFLVIVGVLLLRPKGLFGRDVRERV